MGLDSPKLLRRRGPTAPAADATQPTEATAVPTDPPRSAQRATAAPDGFEAAPAPELFGVPSDRGGHRVSNFDSIIPNLVGQLEARHGKPGAKLKAIFGVVHGAQPFSHAFTAYRVNRPDGSVGFEVANIRGPVPGRKDIRLMNFMPLEEYLFGIDEFRKGNPQRGAYNCDIDLVLVYDEKVDAERMRAYAQHIDRLSREDNAARFDLLFGRLRNVSRAPLEELHLTRKIRRGNCARWSAEVLRAGGAIDKNTVWPNRIPLWLKKRHGDDAVMVRIPRIEHATRTSKKARGIRPEVNPLTFVLHKTLGYRSIAERKYGPTPNAVAQLVVPPPDYTVEIQPYVFTKTKRGRKQPAVENRPPET